jgi:hypothetical protein
MYCLFYVVLSIVYVYLCTVLMPPCGYLIAVKYITSQLLYVCLFGWYSPVILKGVMTLEPKPNFIYYVDRWLSVGYRNAFRAINQTVSSSRMPTCRYKTLIISLGMKLGLRANVGFVSDRRIQLWNMPICCFVARRAVRSCHYSCWNVIPTS